MSKKRYVVERFVSDKRHASAEKKENVSFGTLEEAKAEAEKWNDSGDDHVSMVFNSKDMTHPICCDTFLI